MSVLIYGRHNVRGKIDNCIGGQPRVIDEGFLQWRGIRSLGVCAGSFSLDRPRKRCINTMECLRKRGLEVRPARRIAQDRRECLGQPGGRTPNLNVMPQLYEAFEGCNSVCGRALKGNFLLKLFIYFTVSQFINMVRSHLPLVGGGGSVIFIEFSYSTYMLGYL